MKDIILLMLRMLLLQVQQKRWKIETFSRLDSVLLLSSINLPGGILVSVFGQRHSIKHG